MVEHHLGHLQDVEFDVQTSRLQGGVSDTTVAAAVTDQTTLIAQLDSEDVE